MKDIPMGEIAIQQSSADEFVVSTRYDGDANFDNLDSESNQVFDTPANCEALVNGAALGSRLYLAIDPQAAYAEVFSDDIACLALCERQDMEMIAATRVALVTLKPPAQAPLSLGDQMS